MTASFAFTTFLEVAAVILLLLGFLYEKQFIAFERKLRRAVARAIRMHRARKLEEKRRAETARQNPAVPARVTLRVAKQKKRHTEWVA